MISSGLIFTHVEFTNKNEEEADNSSLGSYMNSHIHIYTNMYLYYLKNLLPRNAAVLLIIGLSCFSSLRFSESKLPQDEVDALQQIAITMGAKYWKFNGDSCQVEQVGVNVLKGFSLPGVLPPELVKLPYIQTIDFAYNYLSGTIPHEWFSMQLKSISVLANRLSGEIPKELGNVSSLTFLYWASFWPMDFQENVAVIFLFFSFSNLNGDFEPGILKQTNFLAVFLLNLGNLIT
ncbi:unnamed protein product [Camellia sinensis]